MDIATREKLGATLVALAECATGPASVLGVWYGSEDDDQKPTFYLLASDAAAPHLIGDAGRNAGCLRVLLRVRAQLLGVRQTINARVVRREEHVPLTAQRVRGQPGATPVASTSEGQSRPGATVGEEPTDKDLGSAPGVVTEAARRLPCGCWCC